MAECYDQMPFLMSSKFGERDQYFHRGKYLGDFQPRLKSEKLLLYGFNSRSNNDMLTLSES